MKLYIVIISFALVLGCTYEAFAQIDLGKKIKKKVERKVEKGVDKAIDKTLDATEDAIENSGKESKDEKPVNKNNQTTSGSNNSSDVGSTKSDKQSQDELKIWSKYDFVAGDKVIFHDDLSAEQHGEFPSRWDLTSGSAEIAILGSEKVIHLTSKQSVIVPLMEKKNFLPEVFTIEFDAFFEETTGAGYNVYRVRFYEGRANSKRIDGELVYPISIRRNEVKMNNFGGKISTHKEESKDRSGKWRRVAISFNKRALKVYFDEERMINIPNLGYKPEMFSIGIDFIGGNFKMSAVKNIRVNEGGKTLYERVISDGKFVTTGILFDVNKSTIKGESMGAINEIVKMMKEHSDLKFSIEGHTDSDGDASINQKLSDERAASVKNVLVQSGIDASRLTTKGWGESKPVDSNSTPEGKANNRRVEFIKI